MEDLCTLANIHADDLSTHAVSIAFLAWALNDAHESGTQLDKAAFHRAAELALTLYGEEKARFASVDCPAPLLDRLYLKAFVAEDTEESASHGAEEQEVAAAEGVARRFHAEMMRLLYFRLSGKAETAVGAPRSL